MTGNEFAAWLEGFLEDKTELTASDKSKIKQKAGDVSAPIYPLSPNLPSPTYPSYPPNYPSYPQYPTTPYFTWTS